MKKKVHAKWPKVKEVGQQAPKLELSPDEKLIVVQLKWIEELKLLFQKVRVRRR